MSQCTTSSIPQETLDKHAEEDYQVLLSYYKSLPSETARLFMKDAIEGGLDEQMIWRHYAAIQNLDLPWSDVPGMYEAITYVKFGGVHSYLEQMVKWENFNPGQYERALAVKACLEQL